MTGIFTGLIRRVGKVGLVALGPWWRNFGRLLTFGVQTHRGRGKKGILGDWGFFPKFESSLERGQKGGLLLKSVGPLGGRGNPGIFFKRV